MSQTLTQFDDHAAERIISRYRLLQKEQPSIRARNAARMLNISEGDLLAARVGAGAARLIDDAEVILKNILPLGEVMALTRNEACVHERKGIYDNHEFFRHGKMAMGLFLNPDIDLRLFMNHWRYNFAVSEQTRSGLRKSLQFFDQQGSAVHKIYLTERSDAGAYEDMVAAYRHPQQDRFINSQPYPSAETVKPDDEIDWAAFRAAWENLKDTHDFHPMLRKFKVGREQAFRHIGEDFAYAVNHDAPRLVLELVRDTQCEMMVFVGNRGCIQIHTGPVKKLVQHGNWYNVLDPLFNLHLDEDQIAQCWVTKKPTEDGVVTALEIFDKAGGIIATFFGKRKPGLPELDLWREIIAKIPALK